MVLAGPTAVGKGTIVRRLVELDGGTVSPGGTVAGHEGPEILRVGVPHVGGNGPVLESSHLDRGKQVLQASVHALGDMNPLAFPRDVLGSEQERSQQVEGDSPDEQDQGEQRAEDQAQPPVDPAREFSRRRPVVLDCSRHG
jgi:hypothetical protein